MRRVVTHLWTLLFAAAVVGFAITAHRDAWVLWRWGCLTLTGVGLCRGWVVLDQPVRTIFGVSHLPSGTGRIVMVACLGVVTAVTYRGFLETTLLPSSLHWFALTAMGIGLAEELVWRGWMQGTLTETLGPWCAVLVVAASHTAYKTALFVFPPDGVAMRTPGALLLMATLTFCLGTGLGLSRVRQGTIAAPMLAHAVFDLLVYGGYTATPWWVW